MVGMKRLAPICALAFALDIGSPAQAQSQLLFSCGASAGHAFYLEEGFLQPGDGGWTEDGLSNGQIILLQNGETADILYRDTLGTTSVSEDGGRVIPLSISRERALLAVYYPKVVEHYLFTRNATASQVVWTQIKHDALINKAAAFQADCER